MNCFQQSTRFCVVHDMNTDDLNALSKLLDLTVTLEEVQVSPALGYPPLLDLLPKGFWTGGKDIRSHTQAELKRLLIELYPAIPLDRRGNRGKLPRQPNQPGWEHLWGSLTEIPDFDPTEYRVDKFGIVIWRAARRGSELAWAVDHFFPHSLGGLDALPNLCIISEAANYHKLNKLDCFVNSANFSRGLRVHQFLELVGDLGEAAFQEAFGIVANRPAVSQGHSTSMGTSTNPSQPSSQYGSSVPYDWSHGAVAEAESAYRDVASGEAQPGVLTPRHSATNHANLLGSDMWASGAPGFAAKTPLSARGPSRGKEVHQRMRWTPEDETALRAAVAACHKGNWTRIRLHNPLLEKYSTVQLKDKWRNLEGKEDRMQAARTPRGHTPAPWAKSNRENIRTAANTPLPGPHTPRHNLSTMYPLIVGTPVHQTAALHHSGTPNLFTPRNHLANIPEQIPSSSACVQGPHDSVFAAANPEATGSGAQPVSYPMASVSAPHAERNSRANRGEDLYGYQGPAVMPSDPNPGRNPFPSTTKGQVLTGHMPDGHVPAAGQLRDGNPLERAPSVEPTRGGSGPDALYPAENNSAGSKKEDGWEEGGTHSSLVHIPPPQTPGIRYNYNADRHQGTVGRYSAAAGSTAHSGLQDALPVHHEGGLKVEATAPAAAADMSHGAITWYPCGRGMPLPSHTVIKQEDDCQASALVATPECLTSPTPDGGREALQASHTKQTLLGGGYAAPLPQEGTDGSNAHVGTLEEDITASVDLHARSDQRATHVKDLLHRVHAAANDAGRAASNVACLDRQLASLRAHEHLLWQQVAQARQQMGDSEREAMHIRASIVQAEAVLAADKAAAELAERDVQAARSNALESLQLLAANLNAQPDEVFPGLHSVLPRRPDVDHKIPQGPNPAVGPISLLATMPVRPSDLQTMAAVESTGLSGRANQAARPNPAHMHSPSLSSSPTPVSALPLCITVPLGPPHLKMQHAKGPESAENGGLGRSAEVPKSTLSPSAEPFDPSATTPRPLSPDPGLGHSPMACRNVPFMPPVVPAHHNTLAKPRMLGDKQETVIAGEAASLGNESGPRPQPALQLHNVEARLSGQCVRGLDGLEEVEGEPLGQVPPDVLNGGPLVCGTPRTTEDDADAPQFGSFSPTMVRRLFTSGVAPQGLQSMCHFGSRPQQQSTMEASFDMTALHPASTQGSGPFIKGENATLSERPGHATVQCCKDGDEESTGKCRERDWECTQNSEESDTGSMVDHRSGNKESAGQCTEDDAESAVGYAEERETLGQSGGVSVQCDVTCRLMENLLDNPHHDGAPQAPLLAPHSTVFKGFDARAGTQPAAEWLASFPASVTPVHAPAVVSVTSLCLELSPWSGSSTSASPLPLPLTPVACRTSPGDGNPSSASAPPRPASPLPLTSFAHSPDETESSPGSVSLVVPQTLPLNPIAHSTSFDEVHGSPASTRSSTQWQLACPPVSTPAGANSVLPHTPVTGPDTALSWDESTAGPEMDSGETRHRPACHGVLWQRIEAMRARFAEVQQCFDSAS